MFISTQKICTYIAKNWEKERERERERIDITRI